MLVGGVACVPWWVGFGRVVWHVGVEWVGVCGCGVVGVLAVDCIALGLIGFGKGLLKE